MRLSAVCAVVLPISAYAAAIVLPFQDSALDPIRRNHQCPRIQRRSEECDNEARCCKPGYGCNTSGKGSVGQVCVKRENNYCADDSACGKDQACITNYVNGVLSSFCGFVEPNPFLIQVKRNNPPTPTPAPRPPRAKCMKTYTVKKGDTCAAIIKAVGGLTLADFYRLNPSVNNPSCNNLQIGDKVCVDPSMAMGASATPMLGPSATGTPMLMPSGTGTPMLMPSGTGTPMLMPSASMAPACAKRVPAKAGDTCVSLIANAGGDITLPDFFRLNPQVNSPSCNNLQIGQMYCVAPTVTCAKRYTVKPGDTCAAIVARTPGLTLPAFFAQNPSVNNPSCNNLQPGLQYCVVPALAPSSMMMAPSSMMMAPSATPMMQKPLAAPTGAPKPARRRR